MLDDMLEKIKDGERRKLELVEGIMFYVDVMLLWRRPLS